jgi:hypothetical protein
MPDPQVLYLVSTPCRLPQQPQVVRTVSSFQDVSHLNDMLQASENSQLRLHTDKSIDSVHKEEQLADLSPLCSRLLVPSIVGFAVPTRVLPPQLSRSHLPGDTSVMMTNLSMPATVGPQPSPSDLAISTQSQSQSRRNSVSSNPSLQIFLNTRPDFTSKFAKRHAVSIAITRSRKNWGRHAHRSIHTISLCAQSVPITVRIDLRSTSQSVPNRRATFNIPSNKGAIFHSLP